MGDIVGVVLGAGLSERMAAQKQLLPYRGGTLLGWCVAEAESSGLDRVVVVLGAAAIEIEASLRHDRATLVRNLSYHDGNLSSLRVGIAASGEHEAIVHLLGDMPEVDADLIDRVVSAWRADRRPVAVTRYRDGPAHPLVLSAAVTASIEELEGPKAIWRLIEGLDPEEVLEVEVGRQQPIDVDTPGDYERLIART